MSNVSRRLLLAAAVLAPASALGRGRVAAPAILRARPPLPLVMLDPGHGGKDPGAIGVTGTYEKHVAFAAAEELRRRLQRGGRCRVELTRGRDVFIHLEDRVAIAQRRGAVLMMSMHADALSDTASDPQTAALARRENSADRFGGPSFHNLPPAVASILGSLVRRETRSGSVRIARSLVSAMQPDVALLANPSRHAGFMVLRAADIPSVLVEMGFMSNPQDEAALRRPDHRARIALALARAVERFLDGPEAGTRLAG